MFDKQKISNPEYKEEIGIFMPPLQAELELFKKSNNLHNVYDNQQVEDYKEEDETEGEDELDCIKRMAGVGPSLIVTKQDSIEP